MNEIILVFDYSQNIINIQYKRNEYMKDIFGRYLIKINKSKNDVFFLYNGNKIKEELKLEEINKEDNEIRILVRDILDMNIKNEEDLKLIKDIICPKCGNICLINFKNL